MDIGLYLLQQIKFAICYLHEYFIAAIPTAKLPGESSG
jgi:hypothetical protein